VNYDTTDVGSDTTSLVLSGGNTFTAAVAGTYSMTFQFTLFSADLATFTDRTFSASLNIVRFTGGASGTFGKTTSEYTNGVPNTPTFQAAGTVVLAVGDIVRTNVAMYNTLNGGMVIGRFIGETVNTSFSWTRIA
jgi:hypothetical protein